MNESYFQSYLFRPSSLHVHLIVIANNDNAYIFLLISYITSTPIPCNHCWRNWRVRLQQYFKQGKDIYQDIHFFIYTCFRFSRYFDMIQFFRTIFPLIWLHFRGPLNIILFVKCESNSNLISFWARRHANSYF